MTTTVAFVGKNARKRTLLFRFLKGIGFVALALAFWTMIAAAASNFLVIERKIQNADAILILSGGAEYKERVAKAASLYRQGVATRILLTDDGEQGGWNNETQRNPYFVELAFSELTGHGVPPEAIEILPGVVTGTHEETETVRLSLNQKHLASLVIVTSPYHTRRALWSFERSFGRVAPQVILGIEASANPELTPPNPFWWVSDHGWRIVISEYLKIAYYWNCCL